MKISTLFLPRKEQPVRCWVPAVRNMAEGDGGSRFLMHFSSQLLLSNTELGIELAKAGWEIGAISCDRQT